jgi:hypothetical protein
VRRASPRFALKSGGGTMDDMKPWTKPWIIHKAKVTVLVVIVFVMPVILFAISEG